MEDITREKDYTYFFRQNPNPHNSTTNRAFSSDINFIKLTFYLKKIKYELNQD